MARRLVPFLAMVALGVSCTSAPRTLPTAPGTPPTVSGDGTSPTASTPPSPASPGAPGGSPIVLDVVADATAQGGSSDPNEPYLAGMRAAVAFANSRGGIQGHPLELAVRDGRGDAASAIRDVAAGDPVAILSIGPGEDVAAARAEIQAAGSPVILLGGDLYTGRGLFGQVFQTTIPWEWQANVLGRYLVTDREALDIVFVGAGPGAPAAEAALRSALAYWGGGLTAGFTDEDRDPSSGLAEAYRRAGRAEWAVVFGSLGGAGLLMNGIEEVARVRPGIAGPEGLLADAQAPGLAPPDRGSTVAPYAYTWAGWAEPIPRVEDFRQRMLESTGRLPVGLEQEGYDAVRVLTVALEATGGRGGIDLTRAIEDMAPKAFSGFPVQFGPDDHLFPPRDELGLFAVAGPKEDLDPWMQRGTDQWRPLMRTFTYDGERTSILDRDRRVFFPFWRKDQPGPEYWRSRYGITTGPSDALH